jgi:hypothetical protein
MIDRNIAREGRRGKLTRWAINTKYLPYLATQP